MKRYKLLLFIGIIFAFTFTITGWEIKAKKMGAHLKMIWSHWTAMNWQIWK